MKNLISFPTIIRLGLAVVFLANGIEAFSNPSEFIELVSGSYAASLMPFSVAAFITFVGFHDSVMALLLASGWNARYVARWAVVWLVLVITVIGLVSVDALEHLGFLAMALSLAF